MLESTGRAGDWDRHHEHDDDVALSFDDTHVIDVVHPQNAGKESHHRRSYAA